jgi:hypothetical protein
MIGRMIASVVERLDKPVEQRGKALGIVLTQPVIGRSQAWVPAR